MKRIFVIGDSISIHYGPYLKKYLKGHLVYDRKGGHRKALANLDKPMDANGGDSKMVLEYMMEMADKGLLDYDYYLINCGLHDIKRLVKTGKLQVEPDDYRHNLREIKGIIDEKEGKLIWITTTPVNDALHNSRSKDMKRYNRDVILYNSIAREIMGSLPIIDLYSFTGLQGYDAYMDHVHFTEGVRSLQAAFIAGFLMAFLLPS